MQQGRRFDAMLVQSQIQRITEVPEIQPEARLLHEFAIELQPESLNGIGPRCIRGQRQEAELALDLCHVVGDVAVEVVGPIVQGYGDHLCLRIMLFKVIKEAIHLLDVEALSATHQELSSAFPPEYVMLSLVYHSSMNLLTCMIASLHHLPFYLSCRNSCIYWLTRSGFSCCTQ